ncbi:hypothetical protein EXIGLDRAFT_274764 [Exidia glandulosa HHB12029]|uniref:Uncharacterized protein n=1 Tax=Exidia glandulosa HHB12029 TaxID=1314781 RepID=A0A165M7Q7_EXIGL|nr:hypothetical protein EXIGLDRAFT_274764 [Exidia glandulosa HHB12029]
MHGIREVALHLPIMLSTMHTVRGIRLQGTSQLRQAGVIHGMRHESQAGVPKLGVMIPKRFEQWELHRRAVQGVQRERDDGQTCGTTFWAAGIREQFSLEERLRQAVHWHVFRSVQRSREGNSRPRVRRGGLLQVKAR